MSGNILQLDFPILLLDCNTYKLRTQIAMKIPFRHIDILPVSAL